MTDQSWELLLATHHSWMSLHEVLCHTLFLAPDSRVPMVHSENLLSISLLSYKVANSLGNGPESVVDH